MVIVESIVHSECENYQQQTQTDHEPTLQEPENTRE